MNGARANDCTQPGFPSIPNAAHASPAAASLATTPDAATARQDRYLLASNAPTAAAPAARVRNNTVLTSSVPPLPHPRWQEVEGFLKTGNFNAAIAISAADPANTGDTMYYVQMVAEGMKAAGQPRAEILKAFRPAWRAAALAPTASLREGITQNIAFILSVVGLYDDALAAAARCATPAGRRKAESWIAEKMAHAGHFDRAIATARAIADRYERAYALQNVSLQVWYVSNDAQRALRIAGTIDVEHVRDRCTAIINGTYEDFD